MAYITNLNPSSKALFAIIVALIAIVATPVKSSLESTMASHALIELPILILLGVALGRIILSHNIHFLLRFDTGGITGILIASFTIGFWMIPRWLDASLIDTNVSAAKFMSLIIFAGVPLAISWERLGFIARGVVKIEFLGMLFRLGWLYLISPDRLCNSYLLEDQIWLGKGFLILGFAFSVCWIIPLFVTPKISPNAETPQSTP